MTDEPEDPGRPHALYSPVPGRYAAHGAFDQQARRGRLELWLATDGLPLAAAAAGAALAGLAALVRKASR